MKKVFAFLLLGCMLLCLAACGDNNAINTDMVGAPSTGSDEVLGADMSSDTLQADSQTAETNTTENSEPTDSQESTTNTTQEQATSGSTLTEAQIVEIVKAEINKNNQNELTEAQVRAMIKEAMDDKFVVGETLQNPVGNNFKMPFEKDEQIYYATITTLTATKEKVADINNINDFTHEYPFYAYYYSRYVYKVKITGKIDKKFAKKSLELLVDFDCANFGCTVRTTINSDGSFQGEALVSSNVHANAVFPSAIFVN